MTIEYNFTVKNVDYDIDHMEVEYQAEGYSTKTIGMPLPKEGQNLQDIISQYAPIIQWESENKKPINVEVGVSGSIKPIIRDRDQELQNVVADEKCGFKLWTRKFKAGSVYQYNKWRVGTYIDINETNREDIKEKYKGLIHPFVDIDTATRVFAFNQVQIGISGLYALFDADNRQTPTVDWSDCLVQVWPDYFIDHTPKQEKEGVGLTDTYWLCFIPDDQTIFWNFKNFKIQENTNFFFDYDCILGLGEGSVDLNGIIYTGPKILEIKSGSNITAIDNIKAVLASR